MKAGEVMKTLKISRTTLYRYHQKGYIRIKILPTGKYDYNDDDVWKLKLKNKKRVNVTYARVSTYKQKNDLKNQTEELKQFAQDKGFKLYACYEDVASDIPFKNRKQFFDLLELVLKGNVERVIITHKDRLSRVGFDLFKYIFDYCRTKIVVVYDEEDETTDEKELFEEITSMLHCFSMRKYPHRILECKAIEDKLKQND